MSDQACDPHADNPSVHIDGERICIHVNISGVPEQLNFWLTNEDADQLAKDILDAVAAVKALKGLSEDIDTAGEALLESSKELKKTKFD